LITQGFHQTKLILTDLQIRSIKSLIELKFAETGEFARVVKNIYLYEQNNNIIKNSSYRNDELAGYIIYDFDPL
jgi:hypothetical protein